MRDPTVLLSWSAHHTHNHRHKDVHLLDYYRLLMDTHILVDTASRMLDLVHRTVVYRNLVDIVYMLHCQSKIGIDPGHTHWVYWCRTFRKCIQQDMHYTVLHHRHH